MGRGWLHRVVLAVALMVLGAVPNAAWAADQAGHETANHDKTNILEWKGELGIWTIVIFVVLFLVLRRYAWGPMLQGLKAREETIQNALDEARKTQDDARHLREQLQAEMNRAQEKHRDIMDQARREAEQVKADMVASARAEIQAEHERRRRELDMARDQALHQLWNQTAQLATLVSAKAIRRQLTPEDHRRLVDDAIAELHQAGTQHKQQAASIQA